MYLNIITPCSRPENLHRISDSINIPRENYKWIVVFDMEEFPDKNLIPENCEIYLHKNPLSIVGHAQRNFALNLITNGYIYFNDDDTLIHSNLWENIKDLSSDFISFVQLHKSGEIRLKGDIIKVDLIDSHNFIISKEIIGDTKFFIGKYNADGYFAEECYRKSKNITHIDKPLSIYNLLR